MCDVFEGLGQCVKGVPWTQYLSYQKIILEHWFLNFGVWQNHPEHSLKHTLLPYSHTSDSGVGTEKARISHPFLGDLNAARRIENIYAMCALRLILG